MSQQLQLATADAPADWQAEEPPDLRRFPGPVAVDLETTGLRWWDRDGADVCGVAVAAWAGEYVRAWYLPVRHRGGRCLDAGAVRRWMASEEGLRGRYVVNLNTRFDGHCAREWGVDLAEVASGLHDVAHDAALLDDHRRSFSLEAVAQDVLGEGKVKGLDMSSGADVLAAWEVEEYARQDVRLALRVHAKQRLLIEAEDLQEVSALEDAVIPVVMEMERNGALLDMPKLERWAGETAREYQAGMLRLAREAGFRCNPDSPSDMERLFDTRGMRCEARTATGRASFTDAVMAEASRDPVIAMARRVAHLADLRNKYLLPYLEEAGRYGGVLRFALHQLRGDDYGTVSGRFSMSAAVRADARGPSVGKNLQQVIANEKHLRQHCPVCSGWGRERKVTLEAHRAERHPDARLVRELFVAAPGRRACYSDAKQIEYRVFAHMANNPDIVEAYRKDPGLDYHALTGEILAAYRPDFERKRVKNCNFAVLFGSGIGKMAEMLGISEEEAEKVLRAYDHALPEGRRLLKLAMRTAEDRGYVRTVLGRRTRFPRKERLHKALNGAVQGSAADLNKRKLVELHAERKRLGLTLRLTVHDEAGMDVPDEAAARGVDELLNRQTTPLRVPILWDTKTGANWAECH